MAAQWSRAWIHSRRFSVGAYICGRVVEGAGHEHGYDLLRELVGPVVVGAVRDGDGQAVRLVVRPHRVVGARLRGVVRRPGLVRRFLREQLLAVEREVAVHLARRDVMEAVDPDAASRLEQRLRADDVGAEERPGVDHGQAVVRLGGEVHDDVDPFAPAPARRARSRRCRPVRTRCGPRRHRGWDGGVVSRSSTTAWSRVVFDPVPREVRSDEAGAAGHENVHGRSMFAGPCAGATAARSPCGAGSSGRASTGSGRRCPSRRPPRDRPTRTPSSSAGL